MAGEGRSSGSPGEAGLGDEHKSQGQRLRQAGRVHGRQVKGRVGTVPGILQARTLEWVAISSSNTNVYLTLLINLGNSPHSPVVRTQ